MKLCCFFRVVLCIVVMIQGVVEEKEVPEELEFSFRASRDRRAGGRADGRTEGA